MSNETSKPTECDNCTPVDGFYHGTVCPKCNRPFRNVRPQPTEARELPSDDEITDIALEYSSGDNPNPESYSDKQVGMLHGFIDGYNHAKPIIASQQSEIESLKAELDQLKAEKKSILSAIARADDTHSSIKWDDAEKSEFHKLEDENESLKAELSKCMAMNTDLIMKYDVNQHNQSQKQKP